MIPRLYLNFSFDAELIRLDKKQINYLKNVLRLANNSEVLIFNGIDGEFKAKFIQNGSEYFFASDEKTKPFHKPEYLSLCYAPVKNVKADFVAKKAAELGITELQPIITKYTIVRKINTEKLMFNMIEGVEQCGRVDLLDIKPILTLEHYLKKLEPDFTLLFFDESQSGKTPQDLGAEFTKIANSKLAILIGPEGGFSNLERELIAKYPNINISLGNRILRSDTAMVAACTIANSYIRNWK